MLNCGACWLAGPAEAVLLQAAPGRQGHRHAGAGARQPVRHLERAAAQRGQVRASGVPSTTPELCLGWGTRRNPWAELRAQLQ